MLMVFLYGVCNRMLISRVNKKMANFLLLEYFVAAGYAISCMQNSTVFIAFSLDNALYLERG